MCYMTTRLIIDHQVPSSSLSGDELSTISELNRLREELSRIENAFWIEDRLHLPHCIDNLPSIKSGYERLIKT